MGRGFRPARLPFTGARWFPGPGAGCQTDGLGNTIFHDNTSWSSLPSPPGCSRAAFLSPGFPPLTVSIVAYCTRYINEQNEQISYPIYF